MTRLERITSAEYAVEVVWECQIDKDILLRHPIVQHTPLNTRDVLYRVELRLWFFTKRYVRERRFSITM